MGARETIPGPALLLVLLAAGISACREGESPRADTAQPPAADGTSVASSSTAAPDPARLVGRWLRSDSDYTIAIAGATPDGKLDAQYLNPNPIHVSKAEWRGYAGKLLVLLELTDRNYPGNFYTLTYDPGSDSLSGVYHHLGLNQEIEVAFSRVSQ
jgi:hypothetical protein